jgi:anti-anti-sigma factor
MTLTGQTRDAQPASGLLISISTEGCSTVLALRGDGDVATRPVLEDTLARVVAGRDGDVVLDLARTSYLDTGSVLVVARAAQHLQDTGWRLTVRSASRQPVMVLAAFGLSHLVAAQTKVRP